MMLASLLPLLALAGMPEATHCTPAQRDDIRRQAQTLGLAVQADSTACAAGHVRFRGATTPGTLPQGRFHEVHLVVNGVVVDATGVLGFVDSKRRRQQTVLLFGVLPAQARWAIDTAFDCASAAARCRLAKRSANPMPTVPDDAGVASVSWTEGEGLVVRLEGRTSSFVVTLYEDGLGFDLFESD